MNQGRIVAITGAAGGMGALFVERFLANRDTVIATDTSGEALAKLAGKLDVGARLHTMTADISDEASCAKLALPVVALGGEKGLGDKVGNMVAMVAEDVEAHTLACCGHFMTEERPQFVIEQILKLSARLLKRSEPQEIAP